MWFAGFDWGLFGGFLGEAGEKNEDGAQVGGPKGVGFSVV